MFAWDHNHNNLYTVGGNTRLKSQMQVLTFGSMEELLGSGVFGSADGLASEGDIVTHNTLGIGTVLSRQESRAEVQFADAAGPIYVEANSLTITEKASDGQ